MHKLVYVCWEGRSYSDDSWLKDQDVVKGIIDPDKPVFTYAFDVGMIFTNVEPDALCSQPVEWNETRHGRNDARIGNDIFAAYAADQDDDEKESSVEFAREEIQAQYWEKWDSYEAWRTHALAHDIIYV